MRLKSVVVILCVMLFDKAYSQFYPAPVPVEATKEKSLLAQLGKDISAADSVPILLSLSNLYNNKPLKYSKNLYQGLNYAEQAKEISRRLADRGAYNDALLLAADNLMDLGKMEEAEKSLQEANDTTRLKLLMTLSFIYYNRTIGDENLNQQQAIKFMLKADSLADKLHDRLDKITLLEYKGMIDQVLGNIPLSEKELLDALAQYQRFGYQKLQYTYLALALLYEHKGEFDRVLANSLQALHFIDLTGDSAIAGDCYIVFSRMLKHEGQKQKALDYARMAYGSFLLRSAPESLQLVIDLIVNELLSMNEYQQALSFVLDNYSKYPPQEDYDKRLYQGDVGTCYLKLKQYDKAEPYFLEEFKLRKDAGPLTETSFDRMAYFYVESKQYAKAKPFLLEALKRENRIGMPNRNHLHYMLFLADSAEGDYLSAIQHLSITKRLDDTIYQKNKVDEIQRLLVQYDLKNKNDQIKLLQQSDQLAAANLKKANEIRDLTIAGILILIAAGGVFIRFYLQKRRSSAVISSKNKQLEKLVVEKEWLLKEVHHRVKNNLQTVISLLQIQAEFLESDALKAIETSQHRIYAMSLLHQKLYSADDLKTIEMADYLPELITYLKEGLEAYQSIEYCVDIEPIQLDVSQAMPIGLIINEAVSNSIKYAFPQRKGNVITLKMHRSGDEVTLKISDNGVGFTKKAELAKQSSMGLRLIRGLSEDINGEIVFDTKEGTHITIRFSPIKLGPDKDFAGINKESEVTIGS